MEPNYTSWSENPYASPVGVPEEAPAETPAPEHGSLALILAGIVLLLGGYLTSNLFAIGDLYQLGFGPDGRAVPSPVAAAFDTPAQQWLFYALTAAAAVAGCVLIGSQNTNPMAMVAYIMCPIVALVFLIGWPLRAAGRFAVPIAAAYLAVGTCLAGGGIMQLIALYGRPNLTFEPLLASLMTEAGLALFAGATVKLGKAGAFSSEPAPHSQSDFVPSQL